MLASCADQIVLQSRLGLGTSVVSETVIGSLSSTFGCLRIRDLGQRDELGAVENRGARFRGERSGGVRYTPRD